MKKLVILCTLITFGFYVNAQLLINASDSTGSGYSAITDSGLDLETPDCVHGDFGSHITQIRDDVLERNVFQFHSHIEEDNDRCEVFDRVRMEIKGGPNTDERSQHALGSESWYRWKFKIPADFKGSSSFCHIFQNKIKGGDDSGFPVITITPRTSKLEVIHNGGDTGADLGKIVNVDLEPFLGNWIEAYVYQMHAEQGKFTITLKDLKSGVFLVDYTNDNIDLWRDGADYSRPKWGIYRSKASGLKDEIIRFSDFCISESEEAQCPADDIVFEDNESPSTPQNLTVEKVTINNVVLSWDEATDNFGVAEYVLYQNDIEILKGNFLETSVDGLLGGTDYIFSVAARDAAGNESPKSDEIMITTDPVDALPAEATNPFPTDKSENVSTTLTLRWDEGENSDSNLVFFGREDDLQLIASQIESTYSLNLDYDSTYYWQIGQKNVNGITLGPIWSFTTGSENSDGPWLVYRGNDRLDLETDFLEARDIPDDPNIDAVTSDPIVPSNNIYQYFEDTDEKFRWRYELAETDTAFTVVSRIKAFPEAKNIGYFEVRIGGVRDKLRINHSTVKLERSSPVIEENYNFDWDADFHLIRVTMLNGVMKVYLDENSIPIATGFSEEADSGTNFEFGKSGGTPTGSFVDWMTILPNQAVGPDEGPTIPEGLIISNDANLASISINGEVIENFNEDTLTYYLNSDGLDIPAFSFVTSSELATVESDTSRTDLVTTVNIFVTAQDGFTKRNYKLIFDGTSSIENIDKYEDIFIYPNPTDLNFTISLPDNTRNSISIFNLTGQRVYNTSGEGDIAIDHHLMSGTYIVLIDLNMGERVYRKLIIK